MEARLQARVNRPVVLINREGLYVVMAALGLSILGCASVLGYSFANYGQLMRNAEEVRSYIASRTKLADQNGTHGEGGSRKSSADAHPATTKAVEAASRAAGYQRSANRSGIVASLSDRFAVLARQEALGDGERAATSHSILAANAASNTVRKGSAEAA
ncbi:hypothetical protein V5799_014898 [Amblyomma americanum]|uniref:Uncharacterized protein n=1 Tax=Amblyomma americanum TaxID=6943 RepID=A0AAQ4E1P7_AMBAM